MSAIAMRERPDDRVSVGKPRQPGQMLGDLDTRHVGRLRSEFSANLGRSSRLHVPDVDVTRAAEEIDQDARFRLAKAIARLGEKSNLLMLDRRCPGQHRPTRCAGNRGG